MLFIMLQQSYQHYPPLAILLIVSILTVIANGFVALIDTTFGIPQRNQIKHPDNKRKD